MFRNCIFFTLTLATANFIAMTAQAKVETSKPKKAKAKAESILTKASCEAAFGMVSKLDGAWTCTLPLGLNEGSAKHQGIESCLGGELVSGDMFCRIIIDPARKSSVPDCDKVEADKASSSDGYMAWEVNVKRPHTDAWKCAKQ